MDPMTKTASAPRLAYSLRGTAGTPVLLIMGFGMRGWLWRNQVEALSQQHRVAFYDHRGVGESERLSGRLHMRDMAADALRLLDELEWQRAHIVGVSMGGMIAQELALMAPQRPVSLSLIATHAGGPGAGLPRLQGIVEFGRSFAGPKSQRARALSRLLYPPEFLAKVDPKDLAERNEVAFQSTPSYRTLAAQLGAVARHDTRKRLHRIQQPTLVVKPKRDVLVRPKNSDRIAKRVPNAKLLTLADAGHGCLFQSQHQVNQALLEHFRDAEADAPPLGSD